MSHSTVSQTALHASTPGEGHGEPCPGCRRTLPIRTKNSSESSAHWECAICHTPLTGILLKDLAAQTADSIRFGRAQFDTVGVAPIPTPLRQLVKEFVDSRRRNSPTDERRKAIRVPVELDVTVLLVDETWNPRAKPLKGIAIDVTPHGIGIVTTSPVDANLAAVEVRLPADIAQILCQVVWTKDAGHGLFNSGLQFLLRFGRGTAIIATDPEPPSAK